MALRSALALMEKVIELSKNLLEDATKVLEAESQNTGQKHGLRTFFHVRSGELKLCKDIRHSIMCSYPRHLSCRQPALWE